MVAEPIRLADASPHARRYSPEEQEAAYLHWKLTAGRSLRKTAEALDIAYSTIGTWSQRGGWVERARREDADEAQSVRLSIGSLVTSETIKSIQTAVAIRDDETASHRDRLNAATWLAGVGGVAPVTKGALSIHRPQPSQLHPDLATLSTEELAARVHAELLPERYPSATTPGPDR